MLFNSSKYSEEKTFLPTVENLFRWTLTKIMSVTIAQFKHNNVSPININIWKKKKNIVKYSLPNLFKLIHLGAKQSFAWLTHVDTVWYFDKAIAKKRNGAHERSPNAHTNGSALLYLTRSLLADSDPSPTPRNPATQVIIPNFSATLILNIYKAGFDKHRPEIHTIWRCVHTNRPGP